MGFIIVIPARHGASRLPGKPLRLIAGKSLIQHVHECARRSGADEVIVATDDERIRETAKGFGARVCMTSPLHPSGTDRLAEVVSREGYPDDTIVVNLQGDEPLMPARLLHQVADNLAAHPAADIATLCERITHADELFNPNVVKVVMDREGYALYFSRAVIPWDRDRFAQDHRTLNPDACFYRHLGIYGYRAGFLREYANWTPSPLEQLESLEQLRALWYGRRIHVAEAAEKNVAGVDTEEDLARVERLLLNL